RAPSRSVWCAQLLRYFFFSSRRRHTRFSRDWSSDVCSSDLVVGGELGVDLDPGGALPLRLAHRGERILRRRLGSPAMADDLGEKIGRASCRERVWIWGVAEALKKNKQMQKVCGMLECERCE